MSIDHTQPFQSYERFFFVKRIKIQQKTTTTKINTIEIFNILINRNGIHIFSISVTNSTATKQ